MKTRCQVVIESLKKSDLAQLLIFLFGIIIIGGIIYIVFTLWTIMNQWLIINGYMPFVTKPSSDRELFELAAVCIFWEIFALLLFCGLFINGIISFYEFYIDLAKRIQNDLSNRSFIVKILYHAVQTEFIQGIFAILVIILIIVLYVGYLIFIANQYPNGNIIFFLLLILVPFLFIICIIAIFTTCYETKKELEKFDIENQLLLTRKAS